MRGRDERIFFLNIVRPYGNSSFKILAFFSLQWEKSNFWSKCVSNIRIQIYLFTNSKIGYICYCYCFSFSKKKNFIYFLLFTLSLDGWNWGKQIFLGFLWKRRIFFSFQSSVFIIIVIFIVPRLQFWIYFWLFPFSQFIILGFCFFKWLFFIWIFSVCFSINKNTAFFVSFHLCMGFFDIMMNLLFFRFFLSFFLSGIIIIMWETKLVSLHIHKEITLQEFILFIESIIWFLLLLSRIWKEIFHYSDLKFLRIMNFVNFFIL